MNLPDPARSGPRARRTPRPFARSPVTTVACASALREKPGTIYACVAAIDFDTDAIDAMHDDALKSPVASFAGLVDAVRGNR
ncbi:MAG: hypothetical protein ABI585_05045 [Betaproteobacteria bacterium]